MKEIYGRYKEFLGYCTKITQKITLIGLARYVIRRAVARYTTIEGRKSSILEN